MGRVRTFIAVEIDDDIRSRCVSLQQSLARSGSEVKWVEPDNLHVTLLFLGEVDERELPDLCRAVADTCAGLRPFPICVQGVGCFPAIRAGQGRGRSSGNRRPRVVWVGLKTGAAEVVKLHDALEESLLQLGCYRREERQFTPHITLGRVKSERPVDGLVEAIVRQADWFGGESEVREVLVMASQLTPQGPVYAVLSTAALGAGPAPEGA